MIAPIKPAGRTLAEFQPIKPAEQKTPKAAWYQELPAICNWKQLTRLLLWFETLFSWVSSLLLVAVVSGLTKRREE